MADPLTKQTINAVIWNDRIRTDHEMVGKTVLLSHFALHNYNGSLTLNSKPRATIQPSS